MAEETIYLCKFRVSVDGDWLCLRELSDVQFEVPPSLTSSMISDDGKMMILMAYSFWFGTISLG